LIPVSEREEVLTLDSGTIKQYSSDVQTRDNAFRIQEVNRSCWIKSSSHSSVSYIIMDQLMKGPLSSAGAVLEVDLIAMTLRKE